MDLPLGQLAALAAAICWSLCSLCFTEVGKKVGSLQVGIVRMFIGTLLLSITCWVFRGNFLPVDASKEAWWYLSLSGVVGFFIGDIFLFRSYLLIGPRMSLLIMTSWPIVAAGIEWAFLSKRISPIEIIGILLTTFGIIWVIAEQNKKEKAKPHSNVEILKGSIFAFLGSCGQALGLVWSKIGMQLEDGQYDAFAATQIRAIAGLFGYIILFFILRRWHKLKPLKSDKKSLWLLMFGSITGPFLGVSLSLLALHYTSIGIAATLCASSPIFVIPIVMVYYKEKVNFLSIAGTVLAFMGVSVLFFKDNIQLDSLKLTISTIFLSICYIGMLGKFILLKRKKFNEFKS